MAEVELKIFDKDHVKKQKVYLSKVYLSLDEDYNRIYLIACDENMEILYRGYILGVDKNTGKFFRCKDCDVPGLDLDEEGIILEEEE